MALETLAGKCNEAFGRHGNAPGGGDGLMWCQLLGSNCFFVFSNVAGQDDEAFSVSVGTNGRPTRTCDGFDRLFVSVM